MEDVFQANLFDVLTPPVSPSASIQSAANSPDSFGCCSSYRACSDAGQCVIADRDYSVNCLYRKNLEAGRIFYGKNANDFDAARYAELRQRVDALPLLARAAFDRILIDFSEYHRSARYCIVRNQHIPELSAVGLFEFRPIGAEFSSLCSYRSYLKPAIISHPEYGPLFRQAQAARKQEKHNRKTPKAGTREFVLYWLDHDGAPIRDLLAEPYRFASLPIENINYAEELYRDTLFSSYDSRIYPLSPFASDGLLSPADFETEESRRLKLSRGYSQEEKERRLAEIQGSNGSHTGNPFHGRVCVITGNLSRMERSDAAYEIEMRGGDYREKAVNSMDILILGYPEWSEKNGGLASGKIQKASELQKMGKDIKIISEDDFYSILEENPL